MIFLILPQAFGLGESLDIELVHPSVAMDAPMGIESPRIGDFGDLNVSVQSQYIRDPLILYKDNIDQGAVVRRKQVLQTALLFDLSPKFGFKLTAPLALQWSTDHPDLARNGSAMGDLTLGMRLGLWESYEGAVSIRGDIHIPSSTPGSWLGEDNSRGTISILSCYRYKNAEATVELGGHMRTPTNTEKDFVLGNELISTTALRWHLWPGRVSFGNTLLMRSGTNNLFKGGAETPIEILSFLQLQATADQQWILGTGKGLSAGYGASEFRAFVAYRYQRPDNTPPPPPPPPDLPDPPPTVEEKIEDPPEEVWEEGELARVEENQIAIRGEIKFELGTATILTESKPTLTYIADLINSDVEIGHVVIEGHASEEGSFTYNYELSNLRARAIFRALVGSGVHPDRISHRGYGEALPKIQGEGADIAQNRRVEFHIIRLDPPDTELDLRELQHAPWDGGILQLTLPQPKKPEPKQIDNALDVSVEDFLEMEPSPSENSAEPDSDDPSVEEPSP
ncbi:MAG: hypothetical protein CMK59_15175 [Proteobacteria bacterium]|nr:hypothetical protein [Pseudomonadota bacterium]